ncbi:MAG: PEP-CTERM sorting domain-containing protein [Armatimonadetes bacterium]|nr:PEP-CTERM sorting domain-containing protein [Armatimonadota bacterium]
MKNTIKFTFVAASLFAATGAFAQTTVTTGELGPYIIQGGPMGGAGFVNLATPGADLVSGASITIKKGLWNSTGTVGFDVDAYINSHLIGRFATGTGYFSPAPTLVTFTGVQAFLLASGDNNISFQAVNPTLGEDFAVGKVDITYNAVPEPSSLLMALVGSGLFLARRRK